MLSPYLLTYARLCSAAVLVDCQEQLFPVRRPQCHDGFACHVLRDPFLEVEVLVFGSQLRGPRVVLHSEHPLARPL
jgi:hypothetical protein